jgi:hypothetical protein
LEPTNTEACDLRLELFARPTPRLLCSGDTPPHRTTVWLIEVGVLRVDAEANGLTVRYSEHSAMLHHGVTSQVSFMKIFG